MDTYTVDYWRFVNSFAPWLSAIGTLSAVIVAIYLARRDKFVRLKCVAGIRMLMGPDFPNHPELISISITNIGMRKAKIDGLSMKIGVIKPIFLELIPPRDDRSSSPLPVVLGDGDRASYHFALDLFSDVKAENFIDKRYIRLLVNTSVEVRFKTKIEKRLRKLILN
jgi:hypothetical protein